MGNTPTQKALIQFAESILITALIAGIASLSNLFVGNGQINWTQATITFAFAVLFSLAHSVSAYLKAIPAQQSQPDYSSLGTVLDAFVSNLEQHLSAVVAKSAQPAQQPQGVRPQVQVVPPTAQQLAVPVTITTTGTPPAQIDWSSTNPAFKAVNLVPPTQQ